MLRVFGAPPVGLPSAQSDAVAASEVRSCGNQQESPVPTQGHRGFLLPMNIHRAGDRTRTGDVQLGKMIPRLLHDLGEYS